MACGGEERERERVVSEIDMSVGRRREAENSHGRRKRASRIFQLRCFEFVVVFVVVGGGGGVHYLSVNEREGGREGGDGDGEDWGEVLGQKSNQFDLQAKMLELN